MTARPSSHPSAHRRTVLPLSTSHAAPSASHPTGRETTPRLSCSKEYGQPWGTDTTTKLDESRTEDGMIHLNDTARRFQNSDSPPSDDLTRQKTTNENSPDMGRDGSGLPCPGSRL